MLYISLIQHIAIQFHNALGYFQTDRNQGQTEEGGKVSNTTNNQKEQDATERTLWRRGCGTDYAEEW